VNKNRDVAYLQNFGLRLKELRLSKGYTQSLFADKCNIERSQIVRLEKGLINPTILTLKILANTLEIDLQVLVSF
jgi:transcriptional regulator with XRE-family HTH domain